MTVDERNAIVEQHLHQADRLARRYSWKFYGYQSMDEDDWKQECRVALILSVQQVWKMGPNLPEDPDRRARLIHQQMKSYTSRVIASLFRTPGRGGKSAKLYNRLNGETPLTPTHERQQSVNAREIQLIEAALDVQKLMQDATPKQRAVLTATLADAFLQGGSRRKPTGTSRMWKGVVDNDRRAMTISEQNARRCWISRQRKKLRIV